MGSCRALVGLQICLPAPTRLSHGTARHVDNRIHTAVARPTIPIVWDNRF